MTATWVKVGNIKGPAGDPGPPGGGPATSTVLGGIKLAGDLTGDANAPTVVGLANKYVKPGGGIPSTDFAAAAQALLTKAGTATQPADLTAGLATKADLAHTHAQSDVTGLTTALTAKADVTALVTKADLVGGTVPQSQIPAIAITDFLGAVANQSAMLALTGQRGDWCMRSDTGTNWQLIADDASQLGNWREHTYPASPVSSVAGRTGTVVLARGDVGLGAVDNTADVDKPVSTLQATAIAAKYTRPGTGIPATDFAAAVQTSLGKADTALQTAPVTSVAAKTGAVALVKADVGLGSVDNTADTAKPISTATQTALDLKAALTVTDGLNTRLTVVEAKPSLPSSVYPASAYGFFTASANIDSFGKDPSSANEAFFARIFVPAGKAINAIAAYVVSAGTFGGTTALNGFSIFADDGQTQLYTSPNDDTMWQAAGWVVKTLGSPIPAQGADRFVYAGKSARGYSVQPSMAYLVLPASMTEGGGNGVSNRRAFYNTISAWPATFTPSTYGNASAGYIPCIALG
jgi:hypothetical protein